MIKEKFVGWLNSIGLYTYRQYLAQIERNSALGTYAHELQKAVNGMSDPARPIVVFSEYAVVRDVLLQPGQQIIVSPSASNVVIQNVACMPRSANSKEGGAA